MENCAERFIESIMYYDLLDRIYVVQFYAEALLHKMLSKMYNCFLRLAATFYEPWDQNSACFFFFIQVIKGVCMASSIHLLYYIRIIYTCNIFLGMLCFSRVKQTFKVFFKVCTSLKLIMLYFAALHYVFCTPFVQTCQVNIKGIKT